MCILKPTPSFHFDLNPLGWNMLSFEWNTTAYYIIYYLLVRYHHHRSLVKTCSICGRKGCSRYISWVLLFIFTIIVIFFALPEHKIVAMRCPLDGRFSRSSKSGLSSSPQPVASCVCVFFFSISSYIRTQVFHYFYFIISLPRTRRDILFPRLSRHACDSHGSSPGKRVWRILLILIIIYYKMSGSHTAGRQVINRVIYDFFTRSLDFSHSNNI